MKKPTTMNPVIVLSTSPKPKEMGRWHMNGFMLTTIMLPKQRGEKFLFQKIHHLYPPLITNSLQSNTPTALDNLMTVWQTFGEFLLQVWKD